MPTLFASYFEDFFICCSDSYQMKALKLEILSTIATDSSIPSIFQEFEVVAFALNLSSFTLNVFHFQVNRGNLQ